MMKAKYIMVLLMGISFFPLLGASAQQTITHRNKKLQISQQKTKEPHDASEYQVSIDCNAPSAKIYIDSVFCGYSNVSQILRKGSHFVEIVAEGYQSLKQDILVNSGAKSFSFTLQNLNELIIQKLIGNMVYVEGGSFTMGATSEQGSDVWDEEKPAHSVTLSSFYIGKYEVTQEEWKAVMGNNPSYFREDFFRKSNLPVERVSWEDCQEFIRKLNLMTGKLFRLPTEAEWEFAARGGNKSTRTKYSGENNPDRVAWYGGNSVKTHDVGQKAPNELGLYDMSGNVWEWCQDLYGDYTSSALTNPVGPSKGSNRILRGGSYINPARYCRVSNRNDLYSSSDSGRDIGLRLAL